MEFTDSIKRNLTTSAYAQFDGRASRSEYWWFILFSWLVSVGTGVVDVALGFQIPVVGTLASLALLILGFALIARRMHDTGRSGWWFLIVFTGIGDFVYLYWSAKSGDKRANKYGPVPK
jgi:uncharacterized membrane protein YhaH (DUF805 family)